MQQTTNKEKTVIALDNATIRVRDKLLLPNTSWRIKTNQHWAILGPNGAGKTSLVRALTGEVPVVRGNILPLDNNLRRHQISCVSFERHQRLIAQEEALDESRYFSGNLDNITTVREILFGDAPNLEKKQKLFEDVAARLEIGHLLGRGIRHLSTGEIRKVLIARALYNSPQILILDEPFDGLDSVSRTQLANIINELMNDARPVILVTHRQREILPNVSHVIGIKDGNVIFQGRRENMLTPSRMERLYNSESTILFTLPSKIAADEPEAMPETLVALENVTVTYNNDTTVLDNLTWSMKSGENWVICGPNGSGKTTLLSLIMGDNPQAYANEVYVFGKRRGSGESIWDIKRRIGVVSSEFQIYYRKPITAFEVVLSGYFDSVGLYRNSNSDQKKRAEKWMEILGIGDMTNRNFMQLSYGEQRMILLARSMVKLPQILILDEPYQGLDRNNRKLILDAIDDIGRHSRTSIIYVTHYPDKVPACMTHMLRFEKASDGSYLKSESRL